ncbi:MAG: restriction endonuclease subunit S [Clostridia bacterium]|nr:restriction endonuclease subunit S [Clostridia bacterium]
MEVKTFILNKTENLDKLSCHSHDPEVLKLISRLRSSKFKIKLNKLLSEDIISGPMGFQLHTYDYVSENYPDAVKLLQISNIDENGQIINIDRDKYIPKDKNEELKKSQAKKNDLIIAKTGTIGRIALFNEEYEANLNQALGIIRLKEEHEGINIIPEFIHLYLNSYFSLKQFMRLGGYRAGQSGLSLDEIGSIYLILPKEDKQREILDKINELKKKVEEEQNLYQNTLHKLNTVLDEYTNLNLSNISKTWITPSEKIFDRIDCYFNSQQLEKIQEIINNLDKDKFEIVKAKKLDVISVMDKTERESNKTHIFKYVDIGNTEKDLGWILGFEEDILFNLPSRAKMKGMEDDILIPRPIGSTQGIIKIPSDFDGELFTTGNIQIRPKNKDEAILLWVMLKSDIMQKQFFYLQSGCSQPEISPNNFKKYVLFPFPKGKIREEIIKKSSERYKEAIKHRERIINLKAEIKEVFGKEIEKYL